MLTFENLNGEQAIPCIQCSGSGFVERLNIDNIGKYGPVDPDQPLKFRRTCPKCGGSCVTIIPKGAS